MTHMFLAGMTMLLVLIGFNQAYCISGIHTAYLGLYKGIVEESVVVANSGGNLYASPFIHIERLNALLETYYQVNLSPYCRSYRYTAKAFDGAKETSATLTKTVRLTFVATISQAQHISKEAIFSVIRSNHG